MDKLLEIYHNIKDKVDIQLKSFDYLRERGSEEEIFTELVFCLLTPQSKARMAEKTIVRLKEKSLLFSADKICLANELNLVRFKNHKAEYICEAQQKFIINGKPKIKSILDEITPINEKRLWLIKNIKGMGLKEASHFLRNTGYYKEIAILDRHILKNLVLYKKIDEIPILSLKNYLNIENIMKKWAFEIKIPLEYLDYVLWYKETNDIY
ncbi:MAG: N-glycosylase/DNA lyase, partial [Brevinematales bacterium]|nr:N-glycosylase/DNA lyase [Brevinematales bacterium]